MLNILIAGSADFAWWSSDRRMNLWASETCHTPWFVVWRIKWDKSILVRGSRQEKSFNISSAFVFCILPYVWHSFSILVYAVDLCGHVFHEVRPWINRTVRLHILEQLIFQILSLIFHLYSFIFYFTIFLDFCIISSSAKDTAPLSIQKISIYSCYRDLGWWLRLKRVCTYCAYGSRSICP